MLLSSRTLGIAFLLLTTAAEAQGLPTDPTLPPPKRFRWTLTEENDVAVFSRIPGRDRHYTQGLRFQFIYPEGSMTRASEVLAGWLPAKFGRCGEKHVHCSSGFSVAQNIYTPQDISQRQLQREERPYAAWLYGGLITQIQGPKWAQTVEVDLGAMGPWARGKEIQSGWHGVIGVDKPMGWKNQTRNEPALAIQYFLDHRLAVAGTPASWSVDLLTRTGGVAGNVLMYGSVAPVARAGFNMSNDFTRENIELGGSGDERRSRFEAYVFAGVEGRGVVLNEMLSGNCCVSPASHGVPLEHGIAITQWGFAVRGGPIRFQWRQLRRSREFTGQKEADVYGVLSLAYDRRF